MLNWKHHSFKATAYTITLQASLATCHNLFENNMNISKVGVLLNAFRSAVQLSIEFQFLLRLTCILTSNFFVCFCAWSLCLPYPYLCARTVYYTPESQHGVDLPLYCGELICSSFRHMCGTRCVNETDIIIFIHKKMPQRYHAYLELKQRRLCIAIKFWHLIA